MAKKKGGDGDDETPRVVAPAPPPEEDDDDDLDPIEAALRRAERATAAAEADEASAGAASDGEGADDDDDDDAWEARFEAPVEKELHFSGEEELTVDAFEAAVTRAVKEKLGDAGAPKGRLGVPRGADELVASVIGALSGKDAKTALSEVRAALKQQTVEASAGGNVIDLDAARRAREKPGSGGPAGDDIGSRIGETLKNTLNGFFASYAEQHGATGKIDIDAEFLKKNGPELLGNLFSNLASTLLKPQEAPPAPNVVTRWETEIGPEVELDPEAAAARDAAEAAAEAEAAADSDDEATADAPREPAPEPAARGAATPPPAQVQVKVDLGSILAGIFKRRAPPAKPPEE
ncbi:MAG: hypothetical protein H6745_02290 [Deltaproteobacteria bacterium]|nr:hypothetical protein [Deltaproteobacteria bacterium]